MYKLTAWQLFYWPEEYWVDTKDEAEEMEKELKERHYSVDIEYIDEGE